MDQVNSVQAVAVWVLPVLFAITLHEVAHGWVASQLGDKTAQWLGRLSLNPLQHIDIVGTVIVPFLCLTFGNFIFGWAKPVPINEANLKNPKRDGALVAIAGPLANFLMMLGWAVIATIGNWLTHQQVTGAVGLVYMGLAGININSALMVLNLLPIPPLDGSRVVASFLSPKAVQYYNAIEPYGFIILIALMVGNILPILLNPLLDCIQRGVLLGFGLY